MFTTHGQEIRIVKTKVKHGETAFSKTMYAKRNLPRLKSKYIANSAMKYVMLYIVGILLLLQ